MTDQITTPVPATRSVTPGSDAPRGDTGLWGTLAVLVEQRRVVLLTATALVVLGGLTLIWLSGPPRYEAKMSFFSQEGDQQPSGLTGIAAQFGVALPPSAGVTASPQFYARLVRSREIVTRLIESRYSVPTEDGLVEGDLLTFFPSAEDAPRPIRREGLITRLREDLISVDVQRETGVVSASVVAPNPDLAEQMASRLLELIQEFNIAMRQSNAAARRSFIEERLETVSVELTAAEQRLQTFLEENRRFQGSPELNFRYEGLQRELGMRQQVVTSLAQSLEQAKIDEVRSTPVLTVLEAPEKPLLPQSRNHFRNALVILLLAAMGGALAGLMADAVRRDRESGAPGYRRLEAAVSRAAGNR